MSRVCLVVLLLAIHGCDFSGVATPAATEVCLRIGERCQLPDGPLGVCIERPCAAGETRPCFACTPQH